jgi:hypothetical protein
MIAEVRRKTNEPTTAVYSDLALVAIIEKFPHLDEWGESPLDPYGFPNQNWTASFDTAAACAEIWEEKAAAIASKFDFSADGGNFSQSQQYEQYMKLCRYYRSKRLPTTVRLIKSPEESQDDESWIANLPESD